jgi:hypothetical protein
MNALVRKEIRLLLPFWGIAMFLAVIPSWVAPLFPSGIVPVYSYMSGASESIFWAFGFGVMLMGLAPFGQEFSLGTFSCLLAQPVERRRVWTRKMLLMVIAAVLVFGAFALAVHLRLDSSLRDDLQRFGAEHRLAAEQRPGFLDSRINDAVRTTRIWYASEFQQSCRAAFLLVLIGVTGGFWTTLLFRQTGAALWFAILVPGVIYVGVELLARGVSSNFDILLFPAMIVYSAVGFFWAWRMFLHAQDSQWLGETISVLSLSPSKAREESAPARGRRPLGALLRKEFQSHQISLLIGFGLLVLHVCTLIFRRFYAMPRSSEFRFAVEAVPLLWLLVPWLIGSVAVAEERKLGTMESQLCLPVTRRLQFVVKFAVALLLGVALGGLMPCLVEGIGTLAGVSSEIVQTHSPGGSSFFFATVGEVALASGVIVVLSFFASTLTRNTLHALGSAVVFGGAFYALFEWVIVETHRDEYFLWKGPLILITGRTVSLIVVLWLSFSNYKTLHAGRNIWLRSVLILAGSLVFTGIATAVIYQRPWELVMSLEPRHGAPRLNGSVQPMVAQPGGRAFALLPDGRLWAATDYRWRNLFGYEEVGDSKSGKIVRRRLRAPIPGGGMFIGGSNWVALASCTGTPELAALQSDGTLWEISLLRDRTNASSYNYRFSRAPELRRVGSDHDWKTVAAGRDSFLAIKTDGTLWGWGENWYDKFAPDTRKYIEEPVQVGTNSDWVRFGGQGEPILVLKNNGAVWLWLQMAEGPFGNLVPQTLNGADWASVRGDFRDMLVIRKDGTLWVRPNEYGAERLFGNKIPFRETGGFFRVGNDSDWAQISGGDPEIFAIKKDGQLIKNGTELFASTLGQPSRYRDWMAVSAEWDQTLALASDGTVSLWWFRRGYLFAPTHRPLWSLNIFSDSGETGSQN